MQPGAFGLNWTHILASLGGCAGVVAACSALFWLKKKTRESRNERPPQVEKLLRPAG